MIPARRNTFTISGEPAIVVSIWETSDGNLVFDLTVEGELAGDLGALFFDIADTDLLGNLKIEGADVTSTPQFTGDVDDLGNGLNMKGTGDTFDVGVRLGTPGIAQDDIRSTSFTLSSTDGMPLTMDLIANVDFGARITSIGEEGGTRHDSSKIRTVSSAAPDALDDAISTDEDTATSNGTSGNLDLLGNDTDADADLLRIVQIEGGIQPGEEFTLDTGGLMTIIADGSYSFDPNDAYEDLAVGEERTDAIWYEIHDGNGGYDAAVIDFTITGVNDAPIISVETSDSDSETLSETNAALATSGTLTVTDVDTSDKVTLAVRSVVSSGKNDDASTPENATLLAMLSLSTIEVLDATEQQAGFTWSFDSTQHSFDYLAHDESLTLGYTLVATDAHGATDTHLVQVEIEGTNDRPVAQNIDAGTIGEDDLSLGASFLAADLDTTDELTFEIRTAPSDADGNQYGSVANNDNGTFTFEPGDQFQFLEAGEERTVSFDYVAVDDSGTANATSEVKTVTITVEGAYDAPVEQQGSLLFQSTDQSIWESGAATILSPPLDFIGFTWNESFNETLFGGETFAQDALEGILTGLEEVGSFFSGLFGGDDVEIDPVTVPSVGMSGATSGKIGLQPFFSLTGGDIDTTVPVDVVFTTPRQVEVGDSFVIDTAYTVDGGATFLTESPGVEFGIDFIFDLAANAALRLGSSVHNLFDIDVDKTINLFTLTDQDVTPLTIKFPPSTGTYGSVSLDFPEINTTGSLADADGSDPDAPTLQGSGEDDIAVLNLDLDGLATLAGAPSMAYALPSLGLTVDIAGKALNLITVGGTFQIADIDLIATLKAVQDFAVDITDLPLLAKFEDGTVLDGLALGDEISVTAPSNFDVATGGDADGLMDFDVDIDMDAVLNNLTTLGFDLDLFTGLLGLTGSISSSFFSTKYFSPFEDGFLVSETTELFSTDAFATLFNDEFPLEGFNQEDFSGAYDIA